MKKFIVVWMVLPLCNLVQAQAVDTCLFMSYNILNFDNTGNSKEQYLREVIDSIRPDILVIQELIELSGATRFRDSVVLKVDTNYAMGTFINSFDTDNGIYYRKDKFGFISNTVIKTELRDINAFKMQHSLSNEIFYIYSVHLKASSGGTNADQRKREVDSLLKVTNLLPVDANYMVVGDFNIYDSNEDAYTALIDDSNPGYFIDPLEGLLTTTWNSASNAPYHTQSTRVDAFGGGSTGGMDDRFDMMLHSQAIEDVGGMYFLAGSVNEIGNDGDHYNEGMNILPNGVVSASLANALYQSSDHIPLEALYLFEYVPKDTTVDTNLASISIEKPEIKIFPNPAKNVLHITADKPITMLSIYNSSGILVLQNYETETHEEIVIAKLPEGVYVVTIIIDRLSYRKVFVKH
jgi:endonuclease/exonuclease/phosphatase family metal-dependent hydrolase